MNEPEFYVGYLPEKPPGIARFTRARVKVFLALAFASAVLLAVFQRPFAAAVFEFGTLRAFEGWIEEAPYPTLVVARPNEAGTSRYLLTVFGKHSAADAVRGLEGAHVRVQGTLVYRDGTTMIELAEGTPERLDDAPAPVLAREALGERTLEGEIVDSKCFLGVMKPGNLKPHRVCATLCIRGGVPPILLVRDAAGSATYYLLVGNDGGPVGEEIARRMLVAEPVRIRGEVERLGDLLVLRAEPRDYARIVPGEER